MNKYELKRALKNRDNVYGTLVLSTSPQWLDVIKGTGIDFVFIDTEHTPQDRFQISWMCKGYSLSGIAPIVRIPKPCPYEACKVLDGGADGVMVPYVETVEEVKALVGAVKYKPLKGQMLKDVLDGKPLDPKVQKYLDENNEGKTLWLNIESPKGMENLDDILKVPGVDVIIIGPHDLSISLGDPENYYTEKFENACCKIFNISKENGVSCGCHYSSDKESHIRWRDAGLNVTLYNSDICGFSTFLKDAFNDIKSHVGDVVDNTENAVNI